MSGEFDPYHRWLGVSPKDQPANHYRLLALDLFERDPEVIRDAAERQMGHVRTYQLGQYQELSQKILNELAAAKACLLDPNSKAAYDAALRAQLQPSRETTISAPPVVSPVARMSGTPHPASFSPQKSLLVAGGAAVLLVTIGLIVLLCFAAPGEKPSLSRGDKGATKQTPLTAENHLESDDKPRPGDQEPEPREPAGRPPRLADIPDQVVDEGSTLRFPVKVADPGTSGRPACFRFDSSAASGATIDLHTGVFVWTPTAEQAGTTHSFTVQVQADGPGNLRDKGAFRVTVRKRPSPPRPVQAPKLADISAKDVDEGSLLQFRVGVADPGTSSGSLRFSLVSGAPKGAVIDPQTGDFMWTPTHKQAGTHSITVQVQANGPGDLQDKKTVQITVQQHPPAEVRMRTVLDLSRALTREPIPGPASGVEAGLRVEDVAGLGTPYELKPGGGALRLGQPVDIVLTAFQGVSIHLSLSAREHVVEVAPKVDVGQGNEVALTQQWVKRHCTSLQNAVSNAKQQLANAQGQAKQIVDWAQARTPKLLSLYNMKRQQLDAINRQILMLDSQLKQAQTRAEEAQRLAELVRDIDGKATIHLLVRGAAEEATP